MAHDGGPGPEVMAADTLEGDRVVNRQGEDLGDIQDIMVDVQRGCVAYAVMSCGGIPGVGDKRFAIPWHALTLDAGRNCFVLDAQADEFHGVRPHWSNTFPET